MHSAILDQTSENEINIASFTSTVAQQKTPRLLYFSDGILEDLSDTDTELDSHETNTDEYINFDNLPWGPFLRFKAIKMGSNLLAGADCVGAGLASFLGITTPKFASEIDAFKRSTSQIEPATNDRGWNDLNDDEFKEVIITDIKKRNNHVDK